MCVYRDDGVCNVWLFHGKFRVINSNYDNELNGFFFVNISFFSLSLFRRVVCVVLKVKVNAFFF